MFICITAEVIQNREDRISIKNMQTDKTFIDFKFEEFPGIIHTDIR